MTLNNDQWQEALVQLANTGVTVAPASDVQASGTISGTTAVTITFGTGVASWTVDISGTIGAGSILQFEYLINNTWYPAFGVVVGSNSDVAVSSVTLASAAVSYQGNAAGFQQFRVRCSSYNGTDSLNIKIVGSVATDGGFVSKSLPPGSNLIGSVNVQHGNVVSTANSSTTLLGSSGVFTGTSESSLNYSAISVEVFSDKASAASGLSIQQSQDGTNWDTADTFTVSASTAFSTIINLVGQFFRVVYTNTNSAQGTFRLQVVKQAAETVVPRSLTALGNLKIALNELNGIATQMGGSDGVTAANVLEVLGGLYNGTTIDRARSAAGLFDNNSPNGQAAFVPFLYNQAGNTDRQRNNLDNISLIASAAYTTTQTVADQTNYNGKGVIVVLDMTTVGTGSVTLEIDGKDPVSGKYYAILTGAAVTTNSTNVYTVYPGNTVTANVSASTVLPRTWRVKVTANNANSAVYSVGCMIML